MLTPKDKGVYEGDPKEVAEKFIELLDQRIERHRLCMTMAYECLKTFVGTPQVTDAPEGMVGIDLRATTAVIEHHLKRPLTEQEAVIFADGFIQELYNTGGLSPCLVWEVGHQLEHLLYEQEPPRSMQN